jgi:hypothetical protein
MASIEGKLQAAVGWQLGGCGGGSTIRDMMDVRVCAPWRVDHDDRDEVEPSKGLVTSGGTRYWLRSIPYRLASPRSVCHDDKLDLVDSLRLRLEPERCVEPATRLMLTMPIYLNSACRCNAGQCCRATETDLRIAHRGMPCGNRASGQLIYQTAQSRQTKRKANTTRSNVHENN